MTPEDARKAATFVGSVTFGIGVALLAKPQLAAPVGLTDETAVRVIGAADLALAVPLLAAPKRGPFMLGRGALNIAMARYCLTRPGAPAPLKAIGFALCGLTVADSVAAVTLLRSGN